MKKILSHAITFTCFLLTCFLSRAQVSNYNFSQSAATYQHITDGLVIPFSNPTQQYDALPIGFDFKFGGKLYNFFCLTPNGMIKLGDISTTLPWDHFIADFGLHNPSAPLIAPMWAYGGVGTVSCIVRGQAPFRILVIDWYKTTVQLNTTWKASCQLKLYETTNQIEFIYDNNIPAEANFKIPVGLNDATSWLNVIGDTVPYVSSTDSTNAYPLNALAGKMFTFYPPCEKPVNVRITDITDHGAQVSWNRSYYGISYLVYISTSPETPDANPRPGEVMVTVNDTTYSISMLEPERTYYVFIKTLCGSEYGQGWVVKAFTTKCDMEGDCVCPEPQKLNLSNLTNWSATISWIEDVTVNSYDVALSQSPATPGFADYYVASFVSSISFTNLMASTHYYIFVRSRCITTGYNNPESSWTMIDFITPAYLARVAPANTDAAPAAILKNGVEKAIMSAYEKRKAIVKQLQPSYKNDLFIEKVYPNPAGNFTDVLVSLKTAATLRMNITDAAGKVYLRKTVSAKGGLNTLPIDMTGWAKGIYIVNMINEKGARACSKIIKI